MKAALVIALAALGASANAEDRLPGPPHVESHVIVTAQQPSTPYEDAQGAGIYVVKANQLRAALTQDGDLEFGEQATVDFADIVHTHGRLRGYAVIRVQGQRMVMPVYDYVEEDARR